MNQSFRGIGAGLALVGALTTGCSGKSDVAEVTVSSLQSPQMEQGVQKAVQKLVGNGPLSLTDELASSATLYKSGKVLELKANSNISEACRVGVTDAMKEHAGSGKLNRDQSMGLLGARDSVHFFADDLKKEKTMGDFVKRVLEVCGQDQITVKDDFRFPRTEKVAHIVVQDEKQADLLRDALMKELRGGNDWEAFKNIKISVKERSKKPEDYVVNFTTPQK